MDIGRKGITKSNGKSYVSKLHGKQATFKSKAIVVIGKKTTKIEPGKGVGTHRGSAVTVKTYDSSNSTVSEETIKFHELFPRLPEFATIRPAPRVRSSTGIIIDWKYLDSFVAKCTMILIVICIIILLIVSLLRKKCTIQTDQGNPEYSCPFHIVLLLFSSITIAFNLIMVISYTVHLVEKFNQLCWLRIEFATHLLYSSNFAIVGMLVITSSEYSNILLGLLCLAATFNGVILTLDKVIKICTGKPAQEVLDDADGNRTRIGIMRLRFGLRSIRSAQSR